MRNISVLYRQVVQIAGINRGWTFV